MPPKTQSSRSQQSTGRQPLSDASSNAKKRKSDHPDVVDLTEEDDQSSKPAKQAKSNPKSPPRTHSKSSKNTTGAGDKDRTESHGLPTPPASSQPHQSTPSSSQQRSAAANSSSASRQDEWRRASRLDNDELEDGEEYNDNASMICYGQLESKVVGIQYYKGVALPGERVLLRREPSNKYDANAIRVDNCGRRQVGHIPRNVAAKLASFIDNDDLYVEAYLTGYGSGYDLPCQLKLFGTSDASGRADLKKRLQDAKLPVKDLTQFERDRKKREKERQEKQKSERKKDLAQAAARAGGVSRGDGDTEVEEDEQSKGEYANLTVPRLDKDKDKNEDDDDGDNLQEIIDRSVSFNPRELDKVASKWGADEDSLSKLPKAEQPDALRTRLLPYQLQGLAWMQDRESPQLPAAQSKDTVQLWKRKDRGFYNIATQFYSDRPTLASGGILADDMGLGKTIQIISLIVADKRRSEGPTLIIAPLSVMSNWSGQANMHVKSEHGLKILVYHGQNARNQPAKTIKDHDLVVTTYDTMALEFSPSGSTGKPKPVPRKDGLFSFEWRRIVLDEGHIIRNPKTKKARAAHSLLAQSRWVLTGTPIVNTLRDLYSHVKFLRLTGGLESLEVFSSTLIRPLARGQTEANIILQALIVTICLRRMKDMKFVDLKLPKLSSHLCPIKFLKHEREKYDAFEKEAKGLLMRYQTAKNDKGENVYSHLLEVLLRLRQTCNHWTLCRDRAEGLMKILQQDKVSLDDNGIHALQQLLQVSIDNQEDCPVCLEPLHNPVITNCKHCFGLECIERVVETQHKCPMCRQNLNNKDIVKPAVEFGDSSDYSSGKIDPETSSSKLATLIDILKATRKKEGVKTIVFSQWTSFLNIVEAALTKEKLQFCRIDGTMQAAQRDEAMEQLDQNADCTIMLASLQVCSVGLNLTAASQVILSDTWWSPAIEDQAVDRVHRLGQKRPVSVFRLVMEDSIEEKVVNIQKDKRKLMATAFQENTVRRGKENSARLADIQKLLS